MYMTLGKMMRRLKGQRHSIIPVTWLPVIFVAGDAVSFCIQGSGAGVVAAGLGTMETGQKIIAGGISLQIVMFGLAAALAIRPIAGKGLNVEAVDEGAVRRLGAHSSEVHIPLGGKHPRPGWISTRA
ncbi:hypothetical protein Neosp_005331 [[Neocosmospora] mangrovei]